MLKSHLQAKVNALPTPCLWGRLQSAIGKELSPPFHFGDGILSALMPSILDKAFKGEL